MAGVGLYLPQLRMDFATIEERARVAEEAGFHSVWLMDHMAAPALPEADCLEGWTVATALAMRTSAIRLGHLVLCNEFRHPALLAKMAATLDVLSGGRLDLGLGWGSLPQELATYGFGERPAAERSSRLAETLQLLDLLFTGEPVDFEGEHWTLRGALCRPTPVAGRIPIHLGGAGVTLTMPLVERYADWWNCPGYGFDRYAELRPLAGSARVSVQHPVGLARSSDEKDEVAALAARRFAGWGAVVTGTPDEVATALRREVDELDVELFIVQLTDFGKPDTIRLFADEVLPALA